MAGFLFSKASLPCLDDNDICGVVNLHWPQKFSRRVTREPSVLASLRKVSMGKRKLEISVKQSGNGSMQHKFQL